MINQILNGRPTGPQANTIFDHIKTMREGQVVSHQSLAKLINEPYGSNRYRSVLGAAFRRVHRELGVQMISERGEGYRYPQGFEQVRHGVGTIAKGVKRIVRGGKVVASVSDDRLPDAHQRAARNHVIQTVGHLAALARSERKTMELTIGKPDILPA